jgi:hypothetical protein
MLARAIRCGWITPEKAESLAPGRMLEVLERKSPRGWIAAAKVLDAMKRTTLASVDTALRVQQDGGDGTAAAKLADLIRQAYAKGLERKRTRKFEPPSLGAMDTASRIRAREAMVKIAVEKWEKAKGGGDGEPSLVEICEAAEAEYQRMRERGEEPPFLGTSAAAAQPRPA